MADDHQIFALGNFELKCGMVLRNGQLAYKTHGTLNVAKDNAVLVPSYYGGTHANYEPLIGEGMGLDPSKYFIICTNMFGNGVSSSPSNTPSPYNGPRFPRINYWDNIHAQHQLITEEFGIERLALVTGFSMGAQQAFHWGSIFPDQVERILPWCGSAKTRPHNWVFLESVNTAVQTDPAYEDGWYEKPPLRGMRAAARVWSAWGLSQEWWRQETFKKVGSPTPQDFIVAAWEAGWVRADANNQLWLIYTWQDGDISDNDIYEGDFDKALSSIKADAIVMPCQTDLYFPPEDNEYEVERMPNAEYRPMPSIWGHVGGRPGSNQADLDFINTGIKELLAR
jgi:homoserine O-acetyltransferase